ncbi:alpha/beta hydrolase [Modestobacter sp. VKM Ac-2979]|uniref:alpha/beta fold hydrolase n=1 Tax=unclassified Modestobacter TaxID=2643866 RepID=UPI0022ABB926|nr:MULTISPECIES: alpha/beta hydrolase [unclassified Modestobacter]MCZ2811432.1 alpha/beta hydrolase [Modestobacter sp. VKM Ac-2979]MCZ2840945.1 alpha/beta hydrolase [Modestobacter sp. VKM Ac-2980]
MSMDAALRPTEALTGPVAERLHVTSTGDPDGPVLLLAHGFGCDQGMWDGVLPHVSADHRVVRYDLMGYGRSDVAAYDPVHYATLDAHAEDILAICRELDLHDVTLVAHSVSTMMALLAAVQEPGRFRQLVLVAASPYFLQDPADGYDGGFSTADMAEVAGALDSNYFTWAEAMAPVIMGTPDAPDNGARLTASFCRVDPDVARQLLVIMFTTDFRPLLPRVTTPSVIVQSRADALVPSSVGDHLHARLTGSTLVQLEAIGHCPHISAPEETAAAIRAHLLPRR